MKKLLGLGLTFCLLALSTLPTVADTPTEENIPHQPAMLTWTLPEDIPDAGGILHILGLEVYLWDDMSPTEKVQRINDEYWWLHNDDGVQNPIELDGVSYIPMLDSDNPTTIHFLAQEKNVSAPDPADLAVSFSSYIFCGEWDKTTDKIPAGLTDSVLDGYYVNFSDPKGAESVTVANQTFPLAPGATAQDVVNAVMSSKEPFCYYDEYDSCNTNVTPHMVNDSTVFFYSTTDPYLYPHSQEYIYNLPPCSSPIIYTPGQGDSSLTMSATITCNVPAFPYGGTLTFLGHELEVDEYSTAETVLDTLLHGGGLPSIHGVPYLPSTDPSNPTRLLFTAVKTGTLPPEKCPADKELTAVYRATKGLEYQLLNDPETPIIECNNPQNAISAKIGEHTIPLEAGMTGKEVEKRILDYGKDGKTFTLTDSTNNTTMTATVRLIEFSSGNTAVELVPTTSQIIKETNDMYYTYADLFSAKFQNVLSPTDPDPDPKPDPDPTPKPEPDPTPVPADEPDNIHLSDLNIPKATHSPQTGDRLLSRLLG